MDNNLFRKEAMEEVTSPDRLDQIIRITNRKTHLLVLGMVLLILSGTFWGFFGSIPVTIQGSGIIMPDGGVHYVISGRQGVIKSILVEPGHFIREKEPVGSLETVDEAGNTKTMDILSQINGRVSEIRALPGDFVQSGEKILSIVAEAEEKGVLEAILFVPAEQGKSLSSGLVVHIQPTNVNKEEYGFIKGVVNKVSEYPASRQRLQALLGTEALVERFSEGRITLEVEVDLIENGSTVSGYQWSTPKGPPFKIYEGTLCYADFIIQTKKPVQLVIPGIQ